jgi:hypothetical protein
MPGARRDMFAQFTIGISRYIEFDKDENLPERKVKGTTRRYKPMQYPGKKQRVSKPKD